MAKSTSTRQLPRQRRPLPVPPVSQARMPSAITSNSTSAKPSNTRQASTNTTASSDSRVAKRLRLAVTEDHDALQNTVLEIPPEKKSVMIKVTRPEREGMPYKVSVASSSDRAASTLRKTVIKATKGISGAGSGRKTTTSGMVKKREEAIVRQQQHQAAVSRSMSSRANLAGKGDAEVVRNRFTVVVTTATTVAEPTQEGCAKRPSQHPLSAAPPPIPTPQRPASTAASAAVSPAASAAASLKASDEPMLPVRRDSKTSKHAPKRRSPRLPSAQRQRFHHAGFATQAGADDPRDVLAQRHASHHRLSQPLHHFHRRLGTDALAARPSTPHHNDASAGNHSPRRRGQDPNSLSHPPLLVPASPAKVMRRQQKEAEVEGVRVAAAENIAPGDVVPSVVKGGERGRRRRLGR